MILNSHDQNVEGYCKVDESSMDPMNMWAKTDLSALYEKDASHVSRKVALIDKSYFVIEDRIVTASKPVKLRWQMATEATEFKAKGKNAVLLSSDGKTLNMSVNTDAKIKMKEWSAEPYTKVESKNPGRKFVGFTASLKPETEYLIRTELIP